MTLSLSNPPMQYSQRDEAETRAALEREDRRNIKHGGLINEPFTNYTVAGLPTPTQAGVMVFVSNETGGAVMAFSDGTNWRRVTDRAVVS